MYCCSHLFPNSSTVFLQSHRNLSFPCGAVCKLSVCAMDRLGLIQHFKPSLDFNCQAHLRIALPFTPFKNCAWPSLKPSLLCRNFITRCTHIGFFMRYRMLSHAQCREQYNKHTVSMLLFFSIIFFFLFAGLLERISKIPITF